MYLIKQKKKSVNLKTDIFKLFSQEKRKNLKSEESLQDCGHYHESKYIHFFEFQNEKVRERRSKLI